MMTHFCTNPQNYGLQTWNNSVPGEVECADCGEMWTPGALPMSYSDGCADARIAVRQLGLATAVQIAACLAGLDATPDYMRGQTDTLLVLVQVTA